MVNKLNLRELSIAGLIAAVYAVISLVFLPVSFGIYQVRIAEALTVLPFITVAAVPGLFIGCLIANIFGGMGWPDIVFGSLVTLVAALATRYIFHFNKKKNSRWWSVLPLVLIWFGAIYLMGSSGINLIVVVISIFSVLLLWYAVKLDVVDKKSVMLVTFLKILSLALIIVAIYMGYYRSDEIIFFLGALSVACAWVITLVVVIYWLKGHNPSILLAPLPPVIFNAFGVSAYLAPIAGFDYWFSVQMIGIGQMIACYLLGLPLLLFFEKRKNLFLR
ncbi:MAG: QueT transporter family protein [candidate division Zixibacteria bacterium]|nr:QueT transporter family protein [candidate division Zixibacteria bacterium]MDD5425389.1 QueT transporter family protein [candidate division Zixibacteria bacterium]